MKICIICLTIWLLNVSYGYEWFWYLWSELRLLLRSWFFWKHRFVVSFAINVICFKISKVKFCVWAHWVFNTQDWNWIIAQKLIGNHSLRLKLVAIPALVKAFICFELSSVLNCHLWKLQLYRYNESIFAQIFKEWTSNWGSFSLFA